MSLHMFSTVPNRVANIRGRVIKAAIPHMSVGISGKQEKMGEGRSDTITFRSYLPIGATTASPNTWNISPTDYQLQEGMTPETRTLSSRDITVTLNEYGILYGYTSKTEQMSEDNIPDEMKLQAGLAMGLLIEKIQVGVLRTCTNQYFAGGSSRSTVARPISLNMIRLMVENLQNNRAMEITKVLAPSQSYATQPVNGGYLVFGNVGLAADIRDIPHFIDAKEYASGTLAHPKEIGAVEQFRFILTPEIDKFIDSGAAVGATGLASTSGSLIDVYQFFVIAENAWADLAVRGLNAIEEHEVSPKQKDHADPMGRRGYFGCSFWSAPHIQNDGWMAVGNVGITNKTA